MVENNFELFESFKPLFVGGQYVVAIIQNYHLVACPFFASAASCKHAFKACPSQPQRRQVDPTQYPCLICQISLPIKKSRIPPMIPPTTCPSHILGRDVYNPLIKPQEKPFIKDDRAHAQKRIATKPSSYDCYITDLWGLEVAGWLTATLMLAVLLILLGMYNQHALSEGNSRLFLNTIIAILGQLIQACLLLPIAKGISPLQ